MSSSLEPWQSSWTIQGTEDSVSTKHIPLPSDIFAMLNSLLGLFFNRDANATRIDIYTGMNQKKSHPVTCMACSCS